MRVQETQEQTAANADADRLREMDRPVRRWFWRVAVLGSALSAAVFAAVPAWRPAFIEESQMLENLSAALYLAAALAVLGVAFRAAERRRIPRPAWLIPLAALVAFLDETSFLGLLAETAEEAHKAPIRLPGGYLIDGVHDLLALPFKMGYDAGLSKATLAILGVVCIGVPGVLIWRRLRRRILAACRAYPPYDYFRFAVIVVSTSLIIDLELIMTPALQFVEELMEAIGGLALLFGGLSMRIAAAAGAASPAPESAANPSASDRRDESTLVEQRVRSE
ncbi:MAG: hypothetical protein ACOCX4_00960 [Planctomycetota bacterium]